MTPGPRPSVANPTLTRPNWLKETPRDPKLLWLDKNENTDPQLLALTRKLLQEIDPLYLTTYPEMAAFYKKLSECENVAADTLLLTAGSDGVIRTVFETFISPGDVVLHTVPTFAMYPVYCMIFGAKAVTLEYSATPQGPMLSFDSVMNALTTHRPRLLCLPNPDSPTGTVFSPNELNQIIARADELGTVALIDEAYFPFYPHTVAPLVQKYSNLIVARTFSKAWGLAGLRTGYAISCPALSQLMHKVRPMYEINTFAVGFIERMIDFKSDVLASVRRLNDGKTYFNRAMAELGLPVLNNQGNFTHVAFGPHQAKVFAALEDLVLYRKDFKDRGLQGYSRFTSATEEIFAPVVNRIRETIQSGGRS